MTQTFIKYLHYNVQTFVIWKNSYEDKCPYKQCYLLSTNVDLTLLQYFKRDADELESWIHEKLQAASDESYKDPTNLQAKIQKHQAFEAEVAAHSNAIVVLDNTGSEMISQQHFASDVIRQKLGKNLFQTGKSKFCREW